MPPASLKLVQNTAPASREDMLAALEQSESVRAALAEKQRLIGARRKQLAAELQKLETDAGKRWDEQQREIDAACALVARLERELAEARKRQWSASQVRANAALAHSTRLTEIESELLETAHPAIDVFIRWCRDEHQRVRHMPGLRVIEGISENPLTGAKKVEETNNRASILARMDGLREAQHLAEDLRLVADQSQIEQTLEKLRAGIPKIRS